MKDHPDIRIDKQICGGQAVIKGHRIMVWLVVAMKQQGMTNADILDDYPSITESELQTAFRYYESHREEIDAQIHDEESP
jgi:uncharacterized protein (DUF433 family)